MNKRTLKQMIEVPSIFPLADISDALQELLTENKSLDEQVKACAEYAQGLKDDIEALNAQIKQTYSMAEGLSLEQGKLRAQIKAMKEDMKLLRRLRELGVDNWEGYDEATRR